MLYYCPECDVFHDGKHKCKRHKYNATPQVVDGERFDSTREMVRWRELQLRERDGEIQNLQRQVTYLLEVNGHLVGKYIADYRYIDVATGQQVVEDCKGYKTQIYQIKRKLMAAIYGIDIKEVS